VTHILIGPWVEKDATEFFEIAKTISKRYDINPEEWKLDGFELKLFYLFSFTC